MQFRHRLYERINEGAGKRWHISSEVGGEMLIDPQGNLLKTKTVQNLSRDQVKMFQDFEAMLERLGLAYQLRCRKCNRLDPSNDGCWGNNDTNASQYVVECPCTKRVYVGADVKLH